MVGQASSGEDFDGPEPPPVPAVTSPPGQALSEDEAEVRRMSEEAKAAAAAAAAEEPVHVGTAKGRCSERYKCQALWLPSTHW